MFAGCLSRACADGAPIKPIKPMGAAVTEVRRVAVRRAAVLCSLVGGLVPVGRAEGGVAASSCSKPADCPSQMYCDDSHGCYKCSYITSSECDAVDRTCCSAAFRKQCPSNPARCPGPPPPPGSTGWHLAQHDSTSCTTTCTALGMTCDASTPVVDSASKIAAVARQLVDGPYTCDDYDYDEDNGEPCGERPSGHVFSYCNYQPQSDSKFYCDEEDDGNYCYRFCPCKSSSPPPPPPPPAGAVSCGINCQWIYAAASTSCTSACSRSHAAWSCLTGSTWPTLSQTEFREVTGNSCSGGFTSGNSDLNPMIQDGDECFYSGGSSCSGSHDSSSYSERRLCPCKTPPAPPPATVECTAADQNLPDHSTKNDCKSTLASGATCHPTCIPGYIVKGGRLCVAGTLVDTVSCTAVTCPKTSPTARGTECPLGDYGGAECTAKCAGGYSGADKIYECGTDGKWSAKSGALTCSKVSCPAEPPAGVAHAKDCPHGDYGATCVFACAVGYKSSGSGDYTCKANGHWEGGTAECIKKPHYCSGAPDTANIQVKTGAGASCDRTIGGLCAFWCEEGYEWTDGNEGYICEPDKSWKAQLGALVCEKRCGEDPPVEGAEFQHVAGCDRTPSSSQPCMAECGAGYTETAGSGRYTCSSTAQWTGGTLVCTLSGCPDASPLKHGTQCENEEIGISANQAAQRVTTRKTTPQFLSTYARKVATGKARVMRYSA